MRRKSTLYTDNNNTNGIATTTITHPFHPDYGKEFKYLGQTNGIARCLDDEGKLRLFPVKNTSLHISAIGELSASGSFITPVEDLLALKELMSHMLNCREV